MFLLLLSLTTIYIIFAVVMLHLIAGFAWVMIKLTRKSGKSNSEKENAVDQKDE